MATTAVLNLGLNTKQFSQGIKGASSKLAGFSKLAVGTFAVVGAGAGVALGVISWKLIKLASDAEETENKFNAVFSGLQKSANETAKELATAYGLSARESQKLLGDTGDLLTGFGFTQEAALDLSKQVQELASDLTSFQNFAGGVEGASIALTKALLGESEQAKALGIVIRQDSKEYKNSVKSKMEDLGVTQLQAKALTALEISAKQSKNALGDYAKTSKMFANQLKLTGKIWDDLKISMGLFLKDILGAEGLLLSFNNKFRNLTTNIQGFLSNWQENFKITIDWVRKNFSTLFLSDIPNMIGTMIKNSISNFATFSTIIGDIMLIVSQDMGHSLTTGIVDGLKNASSAVLAWGKDTVSVVSKVLKGDFKSIAKIIAQPFMEEVLSTIGLGDVTPLSEKIAKATVDGFKRADFKSLLEDFDFKSDAIEFNLKIADKFKEDLAEAKKELDETNAKEKTQKVEANRGIQDALQKGSIEAFKAEKQSNKTQDKIERWTRQTAENTKASASIEVNNVSIAG